MTRKITLTLTACIGSMLLGRALHADFVEYRNEHEAWESLLTEQESIFFTGYPVMTIITDQYAEQGALFTDGLDVIAVSGLYRDLRGLSGWGNIEMAFDEPRTAIAVDFIGIIKFRLFYEGEIVYTSSLYSVEEVHSFAVISDQPFDAAWIFNPGGGNTNIDNLYFGNAVPAPGALAVFALAAARRRRSRAH